MRKPLRHDDDANLVLLGGVEHLRLRRERHAIHAHGASRSWIAIAAGGRQLRRRLLLRQKRNRSQTEAGRDSETPSVHKDSQIANC
jgi:hypothetical protein